MGVNVMVFCFGCFGIWALGPCIAAPTSRPKVGVGVMAPREQCFDQTCNRVTHYCDQVIRNCASCEDDCHPSRITDDEEATKECHRMCDWYYYIKSLNEKNDSTLPGKSDQPEDPENKAVHMYYVTVIVVLVVCFTIIVVVILAIFACYIKRQSTRPLVVGQETRGASNKSGPIYNPPSLINSKKHGNETSLKLLADEDNSSSFEVRTGQQESIKQSLASRLAISPSGSEPSQPNSNKFYNVQVHKNNVCLPPNHEDSSIQPLFK